MKIGLTLGKFAPLHRGHQLVIETALREVDHLIVLIYDSPDVETLPLPVRTRWISEIYPSVEVIEAWDGPTETGLDPEITQKHDRYLKRILAHRNITHFFSSEDYGEHVCLALGAINRPCDLARESVPVSGTVIRSNPFAFRNQLASCVYRDHVTKVVFLGAPSTGKTTLASSLAKLYDTSWMPEYGREYWQENQVDRRLSLSQLVEIAVGHRQREEALLLNANRYLFVDTDASTTLQFSLYYHGTAAEELIRLSEEARIRYDLFFLCSPDIPHDDTWDRSGDVSRQEMHRRIEADLMSRKISFVRLTGSVEKRILDVSNVLRVHNLFQVGKLPGTD